MQPIKTPASVQGKQRKAAQISILAFIVFFALETAVQQWTIGSQSRQNFRKDPRQSQKSPRITSQHYNGSAGYSLSDAVKIEYEEWHTLVRTLSHMDLQPTNWTPCIDWGAGAHPRDRSARFPRIRERVRYYMGPWHAAAVPAHGRDFATATYVQRKTTREYGTFAGLLVDLYEWDTARLAECYRDKRVRVMAPYCRDFVDLAVLHAGGSAHISAHLGDGLPYVPEKMRRYPLFAKVRSLCNRSRIHDGNGLCKREQRVEPIVIPLNRKRHFGEASTVPGKDVSWEKKTGKAVWRGKYGKTHDNLSDHDTSDIKYALVSKHLNSRLVDAKFSKSTQDAPPHMVGSYMDVKDQLVHKYLISVEGNDVSSGLKWMLFSNSVVLAPPFTWESWAMEGKLKPFRHYVPLKADMSNVEEMILWCEDNAEEAKTISERSTLFIYDLLFHPEAIDDERDIMMHIMERYERNFGIRQTTLSIQWDKHPSNRTHRFPSVEERVSHAMGKWYSNVRRSNGDQRLSRSVSNNISKDALFVARGHLLSTCAMANSTYSTDIRALCRSSLPEFDERHTANLKSSAYQRLRKTTRGNTMKLANSSSWRHGGMGMKESKRVLLDDSMKLLCYGDCPQVKGSTPFFASFRRNGRDAILWPFDIHGTVDIIKSGWVQEADIDFDDKQPTAIWGGGPAPSQKGGNLETLQFVSSYVAPTRDDVGYSKKFFIVDEASRRKDHMRKKLSHRYLLATDNENSMNEDLTWILMSESVLLMPAERRITSWLLEGFLQPFQHYVPVKADMSNVEEMILWCEENRAEAKLVSERATLFVHDMFLGRSADRDNEEVKFRVMERYATLFG